MQPKASTRAPTAPVGQDTTDEALDRAAQGEGTTEEDTAEGTGEIDAAGRAAGLVENPDRPFVGVTEVDRRDAHRWELDPKSAEDDRGPA